MKTIHLKRSVALAGLVGVALGAALLVPSAASAQVPSPVKGQTNNGLTLNPTSGTGGEKPVFTAAHACPASAAGATIVSFDDAGGLFAISGSVPKATATGGSFTATSSQAMSLIPLAAGTTSLRYELVVDCQAAAGVLSAATDTFTDYTIVDFGADQSSWSVEAAKTDTATSLTVNNSVNPAPVQLNGTVTLNATVAPAANGTIQFKDNGANLGSAVAVTNGTITPVTTNTLAAGNHPISAVFTPAAGTNFNGSTSNTVTIVVTNASVQTGQETINVNVPQSEGQFTMTVDQTSVQMNDAVLSADNTTFEATGSIGTVTIKDGRNQSHPGWHVTGSVVDFTGTATIDGDSLGWSPKINGVTNGAQPGPAVLAGSHPGLKEGSGLASAAASSGLGTTVLSADLDLKVPSSTKNGAYHTTLTITGFDAP